MLKPILRDGFLDVDIGILQTVQNIPERLLNDPSKNQGYFQKWLISIRFYDGKVFGGIWPWDLCSTQTGLNGGGTKRHA